MQNKLVYGVTNNIAVWGFWWFEQIWTTAAKTNGASLLYRCCFRPPLSNLFIISKTLIKTLNITADPVAYSSPISSTQPLCYIEVTTFMYRPSNKPTRLPPLFFLGCFSFLFCWLCICWSNNFVFLNESVGFKRLFATLGKW